MNIPQENPAYTYQINPDLTLIDWDYIISLFFKIEWKHRKAEEIAAAFKNSTTTLFIFKDEKVIAFGRVVGDGRYYAMLADIVVDPIIRDRA
ncbi:hypothetical protein [Pedobacter sp. UC225_65]|uniref:hypothetical protein n=1 Tax=Pedobacter sp. UC225_65 TaxID=3350173 RepID=UPI00366D57FC